MRNGQEYHNGITAIAVNKKHCELQCSRLKALVGLGKTLEAGIILSQFGAELQEKFFLSSRILESKTFNHCFEDEMEKLDNWAEDVKSGLEKELRDLDAEIKLRKSESKKTSRLNEKVRLQRLIKDIEKHRSGKRLNLYQAQDDVDEKKETLLAKVEIMLAQKIEYTKLITFHWRMI